MSVTTTNDDTLLGPSAGHQSVPHQVNGLVFDAGQPYEKFLIRFEAICFADPAIARLGIGLDGQLAELLEAVGVQAGPLLQVVHVRKRSRIADNAIAGSTIQDH